MLLSCQQVSQLLSKSLDRQLTFGERFSLKLHLMICKYCTCFAKQLRLIEQTVQKMTAAIESDHQIRLPQSVHVKITKALNDQ